MTKLNKTQCFNLVCAYLREKGWIPAGTNDEDYAKLTIGSLGLDDPPTPSKPHFQKRKVALGLEDLFILLGSSISSPLPFLKKKTKTLKELSDWIYENQE